MGNNPILRDCFGIPAFRAAVCMGYSIATWGDRHAAHQFVSFEHGFAICCKGTERKSCTSFIVLMLGMATVSVANVSRAQYPAPGFDYETQSRHSMRLCINTFGKSWQRHSSFSQNIWYSWPIRLEWHYCDDSAVGKIWSPEVWSYLSWTDMYNSRSTDIRMQHCMWKGWRLGCKWSVDFTWFGYIWRPHRWRSGRGLRVFLFQSCEACKQFWIGTTLV